MRIASIIAFTSLVLVHATMADSGPTWQEDPDAGSVPNGSQTVRTTGVGTVNRVNGTTTTASPLIEGLVGFDPVDLFEIDIVSPATFTVVTGPEFDSRLFLFRKGGTPCAPVAIPVAANQRRSPGANGSELKAIAGLEVATYYLAITGSPAIPRGWVTAGSGGFSLVDLFAFPPDGLGTVYPLAPGAVLAEWTTPASTASGTYSMTVNGAGAKAAATCAEAARAVAGLTPFNLTGGSTGAETLPAGCEPGLITGISRTIWVRHVVQCDGDLTVGAEPTAATQHPLAVAAWIGCCNQRVPVGCSVAPLAAEQAMTTFPVRRGDDLLIAIGLKMTSSSLPPAITGNLFIECVPTSTCGDEGAGSCFSPHKTPFCNAGDCCSTVCAVDPYCCAVRWDDACVAGAMDLCVESTPSPDINGDGIVDGNDLALLLSAWGS